MAPAVEVQADRHSVKTHRPAIERVIQSMHHRLDTGMSLEDMARVAFISPFHFNRLFRQSVGIPPGHFLAALRIQAAKRLLAFTEDRIINVCLDVGFTSPGTFSRRFKDQVGLAPLQFRRLARRLRELLPSHSAAGEPRESSIAGEIEAPEGFHGHVFVGLFKTSLPDSRPVSCCPLGRGRVRFSIPPVPDGDYYLLALGFPDDVPPADFMLAEKALRGGSTNQPITIRDGCPTAPLKLVLRPAELTDPPILTAVPYLMTRLAG
jgi:AraC family transcriptional regulator